MYKIKKGKVIVMRNVNEELREVEMLLARLKALEKIGEQILDEYKKKKVLDK